MSVSETLQIVDKVSGPAKSMASSVDRLARSTSKAQAKLSALGSAGGRALKPIEPPARSAAKMSDKFGAAVAKARASMLKEHAAARLSAKGIKDLGAKSGAAAGSVKKLGAPDALGAIAGGAVGSAILTAAAGIALIVKVGLEAAKAIGSLVVEFAKGVVEAKLLRDAAKSMQNVLSGGRGDVVMQRLHAQAIATGQSFETLAKQTEASREAGLSYGDAFKLNNLRGDIKAVTGSSAKADAEVSAMLARVKSGSISAAKAQAELAKKYRVAGDGAKAHEASTKTLGGALARLKNAPGNIFAKIAEKSGPELDKIGSKISKFLEDFNKSGKAAEMVDRLSWAVSKMIAGIEIAAALAGPLWEGMKTGLGPLGKELETIGDAISKAFGGDNASTMESLGKAASMLGAALGFIVGQAVRTAVGFAMIIAGGAALLNWLTALQAKAYSAAVSMISGLVNGIKEGISKAVSAAKELADKVSSAIKIKWDSHSPSKLFAKIGRSVPQGTAQGITSGVGQVEAAADKMAGAPVAAMASPAAASPSAARGGGMVVNFSLTVPAGPGATKEDGEAMASGLVPLIRREVVSVFEGLLAEAGA